MFIIDQLERIETDRLTNIEEVHHILFHRILKRGTRLKVPQY